MDSHLFPYHCYFNLHKYPESDSELEEASCLAKNALLERSFIFPSNSCRIYILTKWMGAMLNSSGKRIRHTFAVKVLLTMTDNEAVLHRLTTGELSLSEDELIDYQKKLFLNIQPIEFEDFLSNDWRIILEPEPLKY